MDRFDLEKSINLFSNTFEINGREEFFSSSVLIPLMFIENEYHFLFEKRSVNISQGGEVCFPGGKVDFFKDKNSQDTAIRETEEELQISKNKIKILGRVKTVFSPIGLMVDGYLGILDIKNIEDIIPSRDEVEYIFSVPVSWFKENKPDVYEVCIKAHPSIIHKNGEKEVLLPAKELNLSKSYSKPWGNLRYKMYTYNVEDEIIWGITARFIIDIIKHIGENNKSI